MVSFKKKAILFSILLGTGMTLWKKLENDHDPNKVSHQYFQTSSEEKSDRPSEWKSYSLEHKNGAEIIERTPTPMELKQLKLDQYKNQSKLESPEQKNFIQRYPSSTAIKDPSSTGKQTPVHIWGGEHSDVNPTEQDLKQQLTFTNKYNDNWEKLLAQDLLRFQKPKTELYMAKEKSIIKILPGNKAIYLEEVFVTFVDQQNPDGNLPISYKALVDSESGKVLATWNRTHIDPMKSREEKILPDLMPSGGI